MDDSLGLVRWATPGRADMKPGWRRPHIVFEPRALWIGVYWTRYHPPGDDGQVLGEWLKVYVCILPMLPLVIPRWEPAWSMLGAANPDGPA